MLFVTRLPIPIVTVVSGYGPDALSEWRSVLKREGGGEGLIGSAARQECT